MPHAYTEVQPAEQPAIGLFAELGLTTVSALEETFGGTGTLMCETKGEVALVSWWRAASERLYPALPPEASIADLISVRTSVSPSGETMIFGETACCPALRLI